jgi:hypothetical protein
MSTLQMETIHEDGTDDLHHVAEVLRDEFGVRSEELPIDVRSQARLGRGQGSGCVRATSRKSMSC